MDSVNNHLIRDLGDFDGYWAIRRSSSFLLPCETGIKWKALYTVSEVQFVIMKYPPVKKSSPLKRPLCLVPLIGHNRMLEICIALQRRLVA